MAMENYVPVRIRLEEFREDYKEKNVLVETGYEVNWEKEAVIFRAVIQVEGKVVAIGHALAPTLGEDKEFEKAETAAIGRALDNLGYAAEDDGSSKEKDVKQPAAQKAKSGLGGGLGKKATPPAPAKEEAEESEDEKSEEEEAVEEETQAEESAEEVEEPKKAPPASGSNSKLKGVMAKYGLKG